MIPTKLQQEYKAETGSEVSVYLVPALYIAWLEKKNTNYFKIMIDELIKHLQDKHDAFIGNQKDQITSAEAKGFKQGLAWAIDSAETMIRNAQAEHEYNLEKEERQRLQNAYRYPENDL